MLEQVTRENIVLKEEIARLKHNQAEKAVEQKQLKLACASELQNQVEMDTTTEQETTAPPPFKKKKEPNEKLPASRAKESPLEGFESRIENKIDSTLETFGKKFENMFSTYAQDISQQIGSLTARITALEMGPLHPPPQATTSVGPIKVAKPYARPTTFDSPKTSRSDTPNRNGSE